MVHRAATPGARRGLGWDHQPRMRQMGEEGWDLGQVPGWTYGDGEKQRGTNPRGTGGEGRGPPQPVPSPRVRMSQGSCPQCLGRKGSGLPADPDLASLRRF